MKELLKAHEDLAAEAKQPTGKFGSGAYKDEPWGLVAMRKRIYACRAFYSKWLDEALPPEQHKEKNPRNAGWAGLVRETLDSLALLIVKVWGGSKASCYQILRRSQDSGIWVGRYVCQNWTPFTRYPLGI